MTMEQAATHVRITDGGTPEFITWREFSDEVEAARKGVRSRKVRTVSSDDSGRTYHIAYADGRRVTVRQATDADKPAAPAPVEQPEERHVTPFAGGKVHLAYTNLPAFPLCRTGAMTNSGTKYRHTKQSVDCANCMEQLRRRAARLEREACTAKASARRVMSDEQFWQ